MLVGICLQKCSNRVYQWKSYGSDCWQAPSLGNWSCTVSECGQTGPWEMLADRSDWPHPQARQPCSVHVWQLTKPKLPRGICWALVDGDPWPCSTAIVPTPNPLGSIQAGVLSPQTSGQLSLPAHMSVGVIGSPRAMIPEVYGKSGLLNVYFTHSFPRSCLAPGMIPGARQPHAGYPASSLSVQGLHSPSVHFQFFLFEDLLSIYHSTYGLVPMAEVPPGCI